MSDLIDDLRAVSREFADAAVYISQSCRAQLLGAVRSMQEGQLALATTQLTTLAQNDVVQGFAGTLTSLKDKLEELKTALGRAGKFVQMIVGLTLAAAGAEVAGVLGVLLVIAGVLLALEGAYNLILNSPQVQALMGH